MKFLVLIYFLMSNGLYAQTVEGNLPVLKLKPATVQTSPDVKEVGQVTLVSQKDMKDDDGSVIFSNAKFNFSGFLKRNSVYETATIIKEEIESETNTTQTTGVKITFVDVQGSRTLPAFGRTAITAAAVSGPFNFTFGAACMDGDVVNVKFLGGDSKSNHDTLVVVASYKLSFSKQSGWKIERL